jgi:hypothetical protein
VLGVLFGGPLGWRLEKPIWWPTKFEEKKFQLCLRFWSLKTWVWIRIRPPKTLNLDLQLWFQFLFLHDIKEFENLIAESQVDWLAIPGSHVSSLFPVLLLLLLVSPLYKKKTKDRKWNSHIRFSLPTI